MNKHILKSSLLATALAMGFAAVPAYAEEAAAGQAERSAEQAVTDAAITAALKAKLLADTRTEGFDINVDTYNGVVTLSGGADTEADKAAATELANTVENVVLIKNDLVVAADGSQARTNANDATLSGEIREEVEDATDGVDEEHDNVVNNAGEDTDTDGDGAADANRIESDIDGDATITADGTPPGGDAWITTKVKAQLLADTAVEGTEINVDTVDQVVTLSGTAASAEARAKAIELAAATGGVKIVIADNLVVAD